nr:MAG TPA: hypothetical protein [Caudoviricetes sp.]
MLSFCEQGNICLTACVLACYDDGTINRKGLSKRWDTTNCSRKTATR